MTIVKGVFFRISCDYVITFLGYFAISKAKEMLHMNSGLLKVQIKNFLNCSINISSVFHFNAFYITSLNLPQDGQKFYVKHNRI